LERSELTELYYIAPISNVPSMCQLGILSHRRASELTHESIAMKEIQNRRATAVVPGGRPLHEYANLYICARNPMLFKRHRQREELCVLRISNDVLDLPGVVVTSGNASSDWVRFAAAPEGLRIVDQALVFAEHWTDKNHIVYYRKKSAKCAEVLIPDRVEPRFLKGVFVSSESSLTQLRHLGIDLPAEINRHMFFL
jgi:hypothetical protein